MSDLSGVGPKQPSLEHKLYENLLEAAQQWRRTVEEFRKICEDVPDAIPGSDGKDRILQAAAVRDAALERYRLALNDFADLVTHGRVPQDF